MVLHKQRRLQCFKQCFLMDIGVRVVYERTWFDITVRIDMQIFSTARYTALHIFAVVPEVYGKDRFRLTEFTDLPVYKLTLLYGQNYLDVCGNQKHHVPPERRDFLCEASGNLNLRCRKYRRGNGLQRQGRYAPFSVHADQLLQ